VPEPAETKAPKKSEEEQLLGGLNGEDGYSEESSNLTQMIRARFEVSSMEPSGKASDVTDVAEAEEALAGEAEAEETQATATEAQAEKAEADKAIVAEAEGADAAGADIAEAVEAIEVATSDEAEADEAKAKAVEADQAQNEEPEGNEAKDENQPAVMQPLRQYNDSAILTHRSAFDGQAGGCSECSPLPDPRCCALVHGIYSCVCV